ncbi:MAG: glycosyl transferase [Roseovarius sp.]|nr:glycosyl transferase [Roseovarius sp.]
MARIAFILLCHKDPEAIIRQARMLTEAGDHVAIHFDARATPEAFAAIRDGLAGNPGVVFARRRIRCGWGEWSLVQATLLAIEAALDAFPRATHFYMLSGDCAPIKSARFIHDFLDGRDRDHIESFDFFESGWIKTGIREERLIYRHFFNERARKWWFYTSLEIQKRLRLSRPIPHDIEVQIGSQWWCLRRRTVEQIVAFTKTRRDVMRFFRTTWIPDETFFQTLVRHLVPEAEIETRPLTFLMFTDYGMPVTFYNDHHDMLLNQDYLFARKISPEAHELRQRLGALYLDDTATFTISNEGRQLFRFLTSRGREGRRFARRFWETQGTLGHEREMMIVACKKWHVAKRLLDRIREVTDLPAVAYLFNEEATALPDLGGIETTLAKRTRHHRALLRMLFDHYETDRLIICIDPASIDLLEDFHRDRAGVRLLEIQCSFADAYLVGHAQRVGLAGAQTSPETLASLLPTLRGDILHESDRIREAGFAGHLILRENDGLAEHADILARFLDIPAEKAQEIAQLDHLFAD